MTDPQECSLTLDTARALEERGSFEDALAALEAVVARLERGRLSIDESIRWYEAGLALSRRCTELLGKAELRIGTLEDSLVLPLAHDEAWDNDDNGSE